MTEMSVRSASMRIGTNDRIRNGARWAPSRTQLDSGADIAAHCGDCFRGSNRKESLNPLEPLNPRSELDLE